MATERYRALTREIVPLSNDEWPWLSRYYSPHSRTPCIDLTPVIRDLLGRGDLATITDIMHAVLEANPGMGTGPEWIDRYVQSIARKDYRPFVRLASDAAYLNLRALFILLSKSTGNLDFCLLGRDPWIIVDALSADSAQWLPDLDQLRLKANAFIREMKRDKTPAWMEYPLFPKLSLTPLPSPNQAVLDLVQSLPPLSRAHLMFVVDKGKPVTVESSTDYAIRKLGLDCAESLKLIYATGLLFVEQDAATVLQAMPKDHLLQLAADADVATKPSWSRQRIAQELIARAPRTAERIALENPVYEINPAYAVELKAFRAWSQAQAAHFILLAFA